MGNEKIFGIPSYRKDELSYDEVEKIFGDYLTPIRHVVFQNTVKRTRENQLIELERLVKKFQGEIENLKVRKDG